METGRKRVDERQQKNYEKIKINYKGKQEIVSYDPTMK
jgi:hypothetical protein